ncbi:MAG: hypothetical protein J5769_01795 [Bacteroidales bacterium]|nr:hypothetical protein [Bacteroidales bacterium]
MKRISMFAAAMLAGMALSVNAFCQQPFSLVCITGQAGEITAESAVINGLAAHNAGESLNIAYGVCIGTNKESLDSGENLWRGKMVSEGDFFSFRVDFLKPGTTYYYKTIARTYAAGAVNKEVTAAGSVRSFTTAGPQFEYDLNGCAPGTTAVNIFGDIIIKNLKAGEAFDGQAGLIVAPGELGTVEEVLRDGEAKDLTLTEVEGAANKKHFSTRVQKLTKNIPYTFVFHIKANGFDFYSKPYHFRTLARQRTNVPHGSNNRIR